MNEILYVVIPCYKEEAVLPETAKRMKEKMLSLIASGKISGDSRVLFVNDGSKDKTWQIIRELHESDSLFSGINLSRNRGHQNALLAGLTIALSFADVTVSMDADLQDDINAIDKMIDEYHAGYDVVYGVRSKRETDSALKRFTAEMFYKFMKLMGAEVVFNHADYRLMSKRALEGLMQFKEVNLFLRGIVPQIGYPFTTVEYERAERFAGESKYPLKKMLSFAFDGISSFSVKPIKIVLHTGIVVFLVSIIMLIIVLVQHLTGHTTTGWTSLMGSLWLLGGIQLISIGLIGEYVGKVYSEVKARPRFIIQDILNVAPAPALPAEDAAEKSEKQEKKEKREAKEGKKEKK
ncbi:MAG: glycosyltransferase family 2 protein [Eubacteriales bacterium]|nr:glycosyltransferase family 2 protein [Eubacteriales bacterium]MDD3881321.1 glycosyltransferase family 2 protein [Eubacteriales bacterium]MDD4513703.1 glycosyltransferase family 2 protein [Eubacteriales bacterium]